MGKVIIKNTTNIPDIDVIKWVLKVMKSGRISNNNKQFCYLSVFFYNGKEYKIVTDLRKCSDVFTIY